MFIDACIRNLKWSNSDIQQDFLSKRSKFGYYMKFPSYYFLEEKPLDLICAS